MRKSWKERGERWAREARDLDVFVRTTSDSVFVGHNPCDFNEVFDQKWQFEGRTALKLRHEYEKLPAEFRWECTFTEWVAVKSCRPGFPDS